MCVCIWCLEIFCVYNNIYDSLSTYQYYYTFVAVVECIDHSIHTIIFLSLYLLFRMMMMMMKKEKKLEKERKYPFLYQDSIFEEQNKKIAVADGSDQDLLDTLTAVLFVCFFSFHYFFFILHHLLLFIIIIIISWLNVCMNICLKRQ